MILPDKLLAAIRDAERPLILTGAGVSRESGIPTFRDALSGLWARFDAERLATPEAFAADPALVWGWYEWRRALVLGCRPNAAHEALADWGRRVPGLTLVTQDVDGLHERAGSRDLVALHGSLHRPRCADPTPFQQRCRTRTGTCPNSIRAAGPTACQQRCRTSPSVAHVFSHPLAASVVG